MERLGAQDLSMVLPEEFGWPQDTGALGILDGAGLLEPGGRFPIEAVRERIGRRLHLLPRFRQLLYTPRRGLGWRAATVRIGVRPASAGLDVLRRSSRSLVVPAGETAVLPWTHDRMGQPAARAAAARHGARLGARLPVR